jgi:hypothetical protein
MALSITSSTFVEQQNAQPQPQIAERETLADLVADLARVARRLAQLEAKNLTAPLGFSGPESGR